MRTILLLIVLLIGGLFAQTTDLYLAPTDAVAVDTVLTSVPTSPTELCGGKDCWIGCLWVTNTTASAVTLLAKDGQGTAFQLLPTASIPANSSQGGCLWSPAGMKLTGGLTVTAGGAGLQLGIHAKRTK